MRKGFLSSFALKADRSVKPPYGGNGTVWEACVACEHKICAEACEESIIVIDKEGVPYLDVSQSGCTFCEACAQACDGGVLSPSKQAVIAADVLIDTKRCIAHHGVICMACKEPCLDDAILFRGLYAPVIDMQACTACGFCVGRCPSQAIVYRPRQIQKTE